MPGPRDQGDIIGEKGGPGIAWARPIGQTNRKLSHVRLENMKVVSKNQLERVWDQ